MPRLVSSAIKFQNTNSEYFDVMCGKRHVDILHRMFLMRIDYDRNTAVTGFMTDTNQFVDRYDAMEIAYNAKQIDEKTYDPNQQLFSEDVWPPEENE